MPNTEETLGYHAPIIPGMDQEGEKLASELVHDDTILRATEEHHQGSNPNNVQKTLDASRAERMTSYKVEDFSPLTGRLSVWAGCTPIHWNTPHPRRKLPLPLR